MKRIQRAQRGFTLIELLIALAILTLLAVLGLMAYDGSKSKATTLVSFMEEVASGNARVKTDTGCYINNVQALFDQTAGGLAANNYCNRSFGTTWNGPYTERVQVNSTGAAVMDRIASGVTVSFQREAGGMGRRYFLRAENVPSDVVRQALLVCNGSLDETAMTATTAFATFKCRATALTGETATFELMFDETR